MKPEPRNPTSRYVPTTGIHGAALAYIADNKPFFTYWDVPRMLRDPWIRFLSRVWMSPLRKQTWTIRATSPDVAQTVDRTLRRIWARAVPQIMREYFAWGFAPGGVEYRVKNDRWVFDSMRRIEPKDARPLIVKDGKNAGDFCGFTLTGMQDQGNCEIFKPYAFWFAGLKKFNNFFDEPPLAGCFDPWSECNTRGGARHLRILWMRKHAIGPSQLYYKPGTTAMMDESGSEVEVDNKTLALSSLEYLESGGNLAIASEFDEHGNRQWELHTAEPKGDVAGVMDYPKELKKEMAEAVGIPFEAIEAAEVGSGWSGRSIPYSTWLGVIDELAGPLVDAIDDAPMRQLVHINHGSKADYEIELISLSKQFEEENKENRPAQVSPGGPPQQPPPGPQGQGSPQQPPDDQGDPFDADSFQMSQSGMRVSPEVAGVTEEKAKKKQSAATRMALLAMLDLQEKAIAEGDPAKYQDAMDELAALAHDPEQMHAIASGESFDMAWQPYQGPRGGRGYKDDETGRVRYQASKPGERRERAQANAKKAHELLTKIRWDENGHEHLQDLVDHLPAMTVDKLRYARQMLGAKFGGATKRAAMIEALKAHAIEAGRAATEPETPVETPKPTQKRKPPIAKREDGTGGTQLVSATKSPLDEFEESGKSPEDITQKEWVDLQRTHRRHLGQAEESGTKAAPFADYEEYHKDSVKRAIAAGKPVPPEVLADYPDLKPAPTSPPSEPPKEPTPTSVETPGKSFHEQFRDADIGGRRQLIEDALTGKHGDEVKGQVSTAINAAGGRTSNRHAGILEATKPTEKATETPVEQPKATEAKPVETQPEVEPTHPEPAIPPDATPREAAEIHAKANDSDYEFARKSAIGNMGEDLKGSARHKRNAWRSLAEAEKDGTAEEMVTRDNLLKAEPHSLSGTITGKHSFAHLAAHLAINAFPGKPYDPEKYSRYASQRGKTPEELRSQYYDAYQQIKTEAEKAANEETEPKQVARRVSALTSRIIHKLREGDRYNPVANALTDLYSRTANSRTNDVMGRIRDFAGRLQKKYGAETSREELFEKAVDHIHDVMEGESFNKTFDTVEKSKEFNPASLYVKVARRKGGRVIDAKTVEAGTKHIMDTVKIRGLQWGNSVSDEERQHHLQKTAEAFADLADVTGLPESAISLGGSLGLAIGARGKGTALAHYEPDSKVINLTRKNGVGSLAHEWGHALDHYIGGGGHYMSNSSERPQHKESDVGKAMSGVVDAMRESGFKSRLYDYIRQLRQNGQMSPGKAEYWRSGHEMFARTFENFVKHKLDAEGRENTYLSGGEWHDLWPTKEEVAHIAPAMDKLMAAIRDTHFAEKK